MRTPYVTIIAIKPLLLFLLALFVTVAPIHSVPAMAQDGSIQAGEDLPGMDVVRQAEESGTNDQQESAQPARRDSISFFSLLTRGGWFMIPLAMLSILVVAIGVERFISLRKDRLFPQDLVNNLAMLSQQEGGIDPRQAYEACQRYPSSASYIVRSMLTRVGRPQMEIENAVNEATEREASRLSTPGSWLTLSAAVAPLIGLLGTVWGITQAFYDTTQLVAGQNRAEALAQGIYTALVTTLCGLLIAIPAAILAHYFENRIIKLMNQIEEMVYNLLPQFERYEGRLRFTTASMNDGRKNGNGAAKGKRPNASAPTVARDPGRNDDYVEDFGGGQRPR
ncbi:MAG: MotA/TolQ/ExbB proton channel family protein [Planctomycetota bacterium]